MGSRGPKGRCYGSGKVTKRGWSVESVEFYMTVWFNAMGVKIEATAMMVYVKVSILIA